jgi:hypothetical protein
MVIKIMRAFLISLFLSQLAFAAPKKVALFVALCDNATQGIVPVPARIGDGNKPEANLYWGCSDGFAGCFRSNKSWKLVKKETPEDKRIFERLIYLNGSANVEIAAEAWRGSEIKACLTAFESALVSGNHDLCVYIGHNALMDGDVAQNSGKATKDVDAMVLCCMSGNYFKERLTKLGSRPVLLTDQLMYPGSFILRDSLPLWAAGKSLDEIRSSAASSYARNQKISVIAAKGVFTKLQ